MGLQQRINRHTSNARGDTRAVRPFSLGNWITHAAGIFPVAEARSRRRLRFCGALVVPYREGRHLSFSDFVFA